MDKTQNHELETLQHALDTIKSQKEQIDDLSYTLAGVMLSVDKWLEGDELKQDEVNRAFIMREKTLQIIESQQAEIEKQRKEAQILRDEIIKLQTKIEIVKTEAYKEYTRKLLALIGSVELSNLDLRRHINNLTNELTERKED